MTTDDVSDALRSLCFLAGVSPDDPGEAAAQAICRVLVLQGAAVDVGDLHSPLDCPVAMWLARKCPPSDGVRVVLLTDRVLVRERERPGVWRNAFVPLPVVVARAVKLIGEYRAGELIRRQERAA